MFSHHSQTTYQIPYPYTLKGTFFFNCEIAFICHDLCIAYCLLKQKSRFTFYSFLLLTSKFTVILLLLQNICTNKEKHHYSGILNGTIHVVAGGGGASLTDFANIQTKWSVFKDLDYGYVELTAFDHSNLLFEYKKSRDGKVYDSFTMSRDYRDILACAVDTCPSMTLAS